MPPFPTSTILKKTCNGVAQMAPSNLLSLVLNPKAVEETEPPETGKIQMLTTQTTHNLN